MKRWKRLAKKRVKRSWYYYERECARMHDNAQTRYRANRKTRQAFWAALTRVRIGAGVFRALPHGIQIIVKYRIDNGLGGL